MVWPVADMGGADVAEDYDAREVGLNAGLILTSNNWVYPKLKVESWIGLARS